MMRRLVFVLAVPALVSACATGFPWAHGPDPGVAATLKSAEPLVDQCRGKFQAALGGASVTTESGPSIERDGAFTRITLETRSTDPDVFHPYLFECRFESDNMVSSAMQP